MAEKKDTTDWEGKWDKRDTQWDHGESSPALVKLLQDEDTKDLIPLEGVGLVPGCGAGYDVQTLATVRRHMIGLDISKTAVDICNKTHPDASASNYEFVLCDFFKYPPPAGGYILGYDYTMLCALPPILREDWAARYAEIIKPGGVLICLMFPLVEKEGGPPYALTVQL
ncbi:S-adenosyl-L-methionine-dependent methyltransferase [Absidia repens]|uniref:S-adenosyl-L-methionine-dependent methyltransferase n=1 Tax=Absidia repens TaxID=90262 RepID=A0A1X2IK12_9FUNG|nr:S-adenosyl-L-methionine-dependent methyltransferase [Absidia repens]